MTQPTHEAVVEVPRFGFVKRTATGDVDFVSPLPCPFNYGSIPGTVSPDGDPLDAVILGPRLARGARVVRAEVARVRFVDAGDEDPKVILGRGPLTAAQRAQVEAFFTLYAKAKRALNRARGKPGRTAFDGLAPPP